MMMMLVHISFRKCVAVSDVTIMVKASLAVAAAAAAASKSGGIHCLLAPVQQTTAAD
jgi:hypothetical protein